MSVSRALADSRWDRSGGMIFDYPQLADRLKKELVTWTESGGKGSLTFDISKVSLQPAAAEAEEASVGGGDAQEEPAVEGFERAWHGCP